LVYCTYTDLVEGASGKSVFRSRDAGEHWELVAKASELEGQALPTASELLAQAPIRAPLRPGFGYNILEVREGDDWLAVLEFPEGEFYVAEALSPAYERNGTLYVLSTYHLYRSIDGGSSWEVAREEALQADSYEHRLTAIDVTTDAAGDDLLLVGDNGGDIWIELAAVVDWQPVG
jgi:photosystem II stability/assembly factor-like uncharacterized protein